MRRSNFLFLGDKDLDRNIYRIIPLNHLQSMFSDKENVLVKPRLWEDPFEHFLLKSTIRNQEGITVEHPFHEHMYGQCWSFENKSDAMWRIYSHDRNGIRVRTTIRKLALSLSSALGSSSYLCGYIGRVRYLSNSKMMEFARTTFTSLGIAVDDVFKTLLIKRPAFKHEREVRLMYQSFADNQPDKFSYSINPNDLIDQILVNPFLGAKESKDMKDRIRDTTGFNGPISRSMLYSPPKKLIIELTGGTK